MSSDEGELSDSQMNEIEPESDGYTSEESIRSRSNDSTDDGKLAIALFIMMIFFIDLAIYFRNQI